MDLRFANSPAIRWFGHYIPKCGMVPAKDVLVCWNYTAGIRVRDVTMVYWPEVKELADKSHPLIKFRTLINPAFQRIYRPVTNPLIRVSLSPPDLWDLITYYGFLNEQEAQRAQAEFSRIQECEWARDPSYKLPAIKPLPAGLRQEFNLRCYARQDDDHNFHAQIALGAFNPTMAWL